MQTLNFEKLNGLIPAIIQDASTDKVLMLGFMNREALERTRNTGFATFFSRVRRKIWTKGETSENYLRVKEIIPDCDGDTLLVKVLPDGPVCHTGSETCFNEKNSGKSGFLVYLENLINERKSDDPKNSYTARLMKEGIKKIAKKVGEEAVELVMEAEQNDDNRFLDESADLIYHMLVLLSAKNLKFDDVVNQLQGRHKLSEEAKKQTKKYKDGEIQWGK